MGRGKLVRVSLAALGVLLAAAGVLYGGALYRRQSPPPPSDWSDWDGTVVFLRDSITEFCDLERFYPGLRTVNRGISGDTTGGMLERVDADVCALAPEVVVVHGGINDIFMGVGDDEIVSNLRAIVDRLRQALPASQVVLQSVYPVEEFGSLAVTERVRSVNARLEDMAGQTGCIWADVYDALAAEDGRLTHGLADDGLHPNDDGYMAVQPVVARAILEAIARCERAG